MSMTGADLAQLEALSSKFTSTGAAFAEKSDSLMSSATDAIGQFENTLNTLRTNAANLGQETNDLMSELSGQADAVEWTGKNRGAFDADKSNFQKIVNDSVEKINSDIDGIKSEVETNFNQTIEQFGDSVKKFGESVNDSSSTLSTSVATQRDNLDQAANIGWTSA